MSKEFKVPALGESVKSATVLKVLIAKGDKLSSDQPVVELETDKTVIEVPSGMEGTVEDVQVKEGDEVTAGQTLFTVSAAEGATESEADSGKDDKEDTGKKAKQTDSAAKKAKKTKQQEKTPPDKDAEDKAPEPASTEPDDHPSAKDVPAAPSVRRFAREIGIDISAVTGNGPHGRISIDDVKAHSRKLNAGREAAPATQTAAQPLPDFAQWGEVDSAPMSKVRRLTAERMVHNWNVIPHVTQFGRADVTEMEEHRTQYKHDAEKAGGRLTLLAILIKTVAGALKAFPQFNAAADMANKQIIYRKYHHIGIAMDTERGLVVPVIRNAEHLNVIEIAVELTKLTAKAREGKLSVDEMRGGCFTISNAGAIGGDFFTPIINWPEAAILGMARAKPEAVCRDGAVVERLMLPLSLSYDHRIIDGADGVRFMQWIIEALEEPVKLLWEG